MSRPKNPWPFDQFFERYAHNIIPEPNTGCWIWLGAMSPTSGYGKIKRFDKFIDVHRCAFTAATGKIGLVVRHSCDVKLCVNPAHLLSGTHADNSADAVARNLIPYGERNGASVLTEQQVIEIRSSSGLQYEIASRYGVSQSTISEIKSGKRWRRL